MPGKGGLVTFPPQKYFDFVLPSTMVYPCYDVELCLFLRYNFDKSIGIFFFFLPIIFLPFLRYVKLMPHKNKIRICSMCQLVSKGDFCPRCGTKLIWKK
jgi:hypothetical protein